MLALPVAAVAGVVALAYARPLWYPLYTAVRGRRTLSDVISAYGPSVDARLLPRFEAAGLSNPPLRLALIALKKERLLELWAADDAGWKLVHTYPILAASGHAGPKLREGDRQVPEGVYCVEALNPNSSYHLSLKLDYPNELDRRMARADGRTNPGGDIFIHGGARSIGCIAVGDEAIEELFVLAGRSWPCEIKVIIAPHDVRAGQPFAEPPDAPAWLPELHDTLRAELAAFRPDGSHAADTRPGQVGLIDSGLDKTQGML